MPPGTKGAMFPVRFKLFTLSGLVVWAHSSWLPVALLLAWTLAETVFPLLVPELAAASYWSMAAAGTVGLLLSILARQLTLILVGRSLEIPIRGTTLFLFGGRLEMGHATTSARGEFVLGAAGILASLILGTALLLLLMHAAGALSRLAIAGVVFFLAFANWIFAALNLLPAWPLSGGHLLRAALVAWQKDRRPTTRVAAAAGCLSGIVLVALALLAVLQGHLLGAMWLFLVGVLLYGAAEATWRQARQRREFA